MVNIIKNLDNKGVTLIELIVSMSLLSIISIIILVIFSSGTKSYNNSHDSNEIQVQGQSIMSFMSVRIMTSCKIINIKDYNDHNIYDKDKGIELGELKLKDDLLGFKSSENGLLEEKLHIFSIQEDPKMEGKSIRYGNTKKATIEAGNYIKSIYVKPLFQEDIDKNEEDIYENSKGIKLTIIMQKGKQEVEISKNIYFRNKESILKEDLE